MQYFTLPPLVRSDSTGLRRSPTRVPPDSTGLRQSPTRLHQSPPESGGVRWDSGGIRWSAVGLRWDSGGTLVGLRWDSGGVQWQARGGWVLGLIRAEVWSRTEF